MGKQTDSESAGSSSHENGSSAAPRRGTLLVGLGAPDGHDVSSVRAFLTRSLTDPAVVRWPAGLQWLHRSFNRLLARRVAPRAAEQYRRIWDVRGSPATVNLSDLASALTDALPEGWAVYTATRYGQPTIAHVMHQIEADGIEELVVIPVYPQFNRATSGAIVRELHKVLRQSGQHINVALRATWFNDVGFVKAQARLLADYATAEGLQPADTHLVFYAHGQPTCRPDDGILYAQQVRRTVMLVAARLGWPMDRVSVTFKSCPAALRSLHPGIGDHLAKVASLGERKVLVCPITSTVDDVETLGTIDGDPQAVAADRCDLYWCPTLNTSEPFVAALRNLVLRGPRPMTPDRTPAHPLLQPKPALAPCDGEPESLVMIGASFEGGVPSGRGPHMRYSDPRAFGQVRKTRKEVRAFLDWVRELPEVREAFVWTTCQRIEFYGWCVDPGNAAARGETVARVRGRLFGREPDGLDVNTLWGAEAWHHLMRTASGLNSALPGDLDVVAQLQTACLTAERAGTAGPRATCLVKDAVALSRDVRDETAWGRFSFGYCLAALTRVQEVDGAHLDECRHVVLGGSATSRSVLVALREHFDVPQHMMTLVYRGHHGQLKLLRGAIGHGRRLRVQSYTEPTVLDAIANADFVYVGVDYQEPILTTQALGNARDLGARNLRVIDFNTFGSIGGLPATGLRVWTAADLELAVAAFAEVMRSRPRYRGAVEEAEEWIENHLRSRVGS